MGQKHISFAIELANTMSWNMTSEDFRFNMSLEPNGCFVLKEDSKCVGLATCINYGKVGWFGNLVIEKSCRGKGAGTLLVKHAITYLRNIGVTTVGLYAYPHLSEFYRTFGFRKNGEFIVLKAKQIFYSQSKDSQLAEPIGKQDLNELIDLDSKCFGESRKKLLDLILQKNTNLCYLSKVNKKLLAYAIAKVYGESTEIGPIVCPRNRPETAAFLLKTLLCQLKDCEGFIYIPAIETKLLAILAKAGFKEDFMLVRMFLGPAVADDCVYVAESLERG
jgi:N-acetylglutamate synthase-like GNAT family acetyltransferase